MKINDSIEYYKKIDKSVFYYGITIPVRYRDGFLQSKEISKGTSRQVKIKWNKNIYDAYLVNVDRKKSSPVLQLRYDSNIELLNELKTTFIQSYIAIESQFFNKSTKQRTKLDGGNQEVLIFRPINETEIEIETFIQVKTPYDNLFKRLVEENVFGWLSKTNTDYMITKSTKWYDISDLPKHLEAAYVVYYLIDEKNKYIYIGSAIRLGDRVKPGRHEIPGWNKFKYEIIHPSMHHMLRRIEFHSINAFAYFFENNGNVDPYSVSEYKLVNKNWSKSK